MAPRDEPTGPVRTTAGPDDGTTDHTYDVARRLGGCGRSAMSNGAIERATERTRSS